MDGLVVLGRVPLASGVAYMRFQYRQDGLAASPVVQYKLGVGDHVLLSIMGTTAVVALVAGLVGVVYRLHTPERIDKCIVDLGSTLRIGEILRALKRGHT